MPETVKHIIAVYPGSFDPITYGHLDVIRRGAMLFNELIVGVGTNPGKEALFDQQERRNLIAPHVRDAPNVRIEAYTGLTIDFVRTMQARVLLRGIRDVGDLSDEIQQANINLMIGDIETVFLLTRDQHSLTSSTYIKQIYELGGGDRERILRLVPPNVADALAEKLNERAARP